MLKFVGSAWATFVLANLLAAAIVFLMMGAEFAGALPWWIWILSLGAYAGACRQIWIGRTNRAIALRCVYKVLQCAAFTVLLFCAAAATLSLYAPLDTQERGAQLTQMLMPLIPILSGILAVGLGSFSWAYAYGEMRVL